jgi:hypothetical protein
MKIETETKGAGDSGKKFNAVRESRKWKEAVWRKTVGMTDAEVVAFFNAAGERYRAERREWERKHEHELAAR